MSTQTPISGQIAVIGMSCRLPGAPDLDAFWDLIRQGREGIRFFEPPADANPDYVSAYGALDQPEAFDHQLFGLTAAEADLADPQQRLLLECAWEVLEQAGYNGKREQDLTAVFAGMGRSTYGAALARDPAVAARVGDLQVAIATDKDHLSSRIAYLLDLRGPAVTVQTACSTSLVAVHMACQNLLHFECDMALAGAASVVVGPEGYRYTEGGILSPDGHCRAFDAEAAGTVPASGAGLVLLKRMVDALADGDNILGVIVGSAVNNDGAAKVGYTAPGLQGQKRVIEDALAIAGLEPQDISYIETHGTATALGDVIEIDALRQVFGQVPLRIGSVKTNIGHCDTASGVAGLIKTLLCLNNGLLVPSLHYRKPNPQLNLGPIQVNHQATTLPQGLTYAGVSSFGIGGTNAHILLSSPPAARTNSCQRQHWPLVLSARDPIALDVMESNLIQWRVKNPGTRSCDLAFSLNQGRKILDFSRVFVLDGSAGLGRGKDFSRLESNPNGAIFLFPGQGTDYQNLGADLYHKETLFRQGVDQCCQLLQPLLNINLLPLLLAPYDSPESQKLRSHLLWQPTLFTIEYALGRLWMEWGIQPAAMIGHSLGEIVAATLAGVLSLEAGLKLVCARAHGVAACPEGAMLAVHLAEDQLKVYLTGQLSMAAVNGPKLCIVSGPNTEVEVLKQLLASKGISTKSLASDRAFHSAVLDPLAAEVSQLAGSFRLQAPKIPLISNVTGTWMTSQEALDPRYWGRHLRSPVRFSAGLTALAQVGGSILLEMGPGRVLSQLAERHPDTKIQACAVLGDEDSLRTSALALGMAHAAGENINWRLWLGADQPRRVKAPTYAFQRSHHHHGATAVAALPALSNLADRKPLTQQCYAPIWQQKVFSSCTRPEQAVPADSCWLVFADYMGLADQLVQRLRGLGVQVFVVRPGDGFLIHSEFELSLEPADQAGYRALTDYLDERLPSHIIHAWSLDSGENEDQASLQKGFESLLLFSRAFSQYNERPDFTLTILANGLYRVLPGDEPMPAKAALLGAAEVIPKEYSCFSCRTLDIDAQQFSARLLDRVLLDCLCDDPDLSEIAYRGQGRWVPGTSLIPLTEGSAEFSWPQQGTYLIVDAFCLSGIQLTSTLADRGAAHLILATRSFIPDRTEWNSWLSDNNEDDLVSGYLKVIQDLERRGVKVTPWSGNVAESGSFHGLLSLIGERFRRLDGVLIMDPPFDTELIESKSVWNLSQSLVQRLDAAKNLTNAFSDTLIMFSGRNRAEAAGIGQSEQAAVYRALGALVDRAAGRMVPVHLLEWGTLAWEDPSRSSGAEVSLISDQLAEKRRRFGITAEDSAQFLSWTLAMTESRVIVSTRDFEETLAQQKTFTSDYFRQQIQSMRDGNRHHRPRLSVEMVAPRNEVEQLLAEIWCENFGLQEVGMDDSFFELGGHSLLAVEMMRRINEVFPVKLSAQTLFEAPTIAELSLRVRRDDQVNDPELEKLLAEIEGLSSDEALSQLSRIEDLD